MTAIPASFPEHPAVFAGKREERFVALALETVVHDMSPVGDDEAARRLGGYALGEEPPPDDAPVYVSLDDGTLSLDNPPFLLAEVGLDLGTDGAGGGLTARLDFAFDSELKLLIHPPVAVTLEGPLGEVVPSMEQMIAEIYRTKGRRLEMLDSGVVDADSFSR